jgi:hypothetical protein
MMTELANKILNTNKTEIEVKTYKKYNDLATPVRRKRQEQDLSQKECRFLHLTDDSKYKSK